MAIYKQLFMALGFHGTSTTFVILIQDTYDGESLLYSAWLCQTKIINILQGLKVS